MRISCQSADPAGVAFRTRVILRNCTWHKPALAGSRCISRRRTKRTGGLAIAMGSSDRADASAAREPDTRGSSNGATAPFPELENATVVDLGSRLRGGDVSIRELAEQYLERIEALDRQGPRLLSVIETNPEATDIADALDHELRARGPRGPLHGIPVLLKDNIDTADQMFTTAGSLALVSSRPQRDAFVAQRLR